MKSAESLGLFRSFARKIPQAVHKVQPCGYFGAQEAENPPSILRIGILGSSASFALMKIGSINFVARGIKQSHIHKVCSSLLYPHCFAFLLPLFVKQFYGGIFAVKIKNRFYKNFSSSKISSKSYTDFFLRWGVFMDGNTLDLKLADTRIVFLWCA